jgi:hypothetical protein
MDGTARAGGGGMNSGGSAPQFNAQQSAADQTKSNIGTGVANSVLNNTNQITPYGSLNYTQSGGQDVNGTWVPQYTATQTLTPQQQSILNQTQSLQSGVLDAASNALPGLKQTLGTPLNFSGLTALPTDQTAFRNQAYDALTARGTTDINRAQGNSDVQLANQGIAKGSEAALRANDQFSRARNDLSNQSLLEAGNLAGQNLEQAQTLRNQGITERQALRNQPLADYQAMLGLGGGVQQPNFVNTPQSQIQPTDIMGGNALAYQGQTNAYNQQLGQQNALMGGLFGLGGSALGVGGLIGAKKFGLF